MTLPVRVWTAPFAFAAVLSFATTSFAEIRIAVPTPRYTMDGLTQPPCGDIPRSATPTRFTAGQSLTVTWSDTVDRLGSTYRIALSRGGDFNFEDDILRDDIADRLGTGTYMETVTLPNDLYCLDCTLQVAQFTETSTPRVVYYACADLIVTPADAGLPSGTDAGAGGGGGGDDGGCGCHVAAGAAHAATSDSTMLASAFGLGLLGVVTRRARRRRVS